MSDKKILSMLMVDLYGVEMYVGTEGGSRTRTGFEAHWILSPARLPIPPLLQRTIFIQK